MRHVPFSDYEQRLKLQVRLEVSKALQYLAFQLTSSVHAAGSVNEPPSPTSDSTFTVQQTTSNEEDAGVDQPYQFSFVDISSKDARKQVRSHVMREFMA